MAKPKDILVTTTSSIEGMKIIRHLQPISAHIVLGTNLFSDFLGGLTDVFGGKSRSYQKRLNLIYEDAIKEIKYSCYEIGGNCVLGLKIDIDEISGKSKSMFMITAIGTAVISEIEKKNEITHQKISEKISVEEINDLRTRNSIIRKSKNDELILNSETWSFITSSQLDEILPYLLRKLSSMLKGNCSEPVIQEFTEKLKIFIDNLPEDKGRNDLYSFLKNSDNSISTIIVTAIIKDLYLLDFDKTIDLLENEDLSRKKIGLNIATFDKSHYDLKDIEGLNRMRESINRSFKERGERTTKKQMISSKEKEVWICECSRTNDIECEYCSACARDIYGFKVSEFKPRKIINYLDDKIELIMELVI